jgi:hypothetical protein
MEWGDYDNDGLLDLLLASSTNGETVKLFRNAVNAVFLAQG